MATIGSLPSEIKQEIFYRIQLPGGKNSSPIKQVHSIQEIVRLRLVCKEWSILAIDDSLWKRLAEKMGLENIASYEGLLSVFRQPFNDKYNSLYSSSVAQKMVKTVTKIFRKKEKEEKAKTKAEKEKFTNICKRMINDNHWFFLNTLQAKDFEDFDYFLSRNPDYSISTPFLNKILNEPSADFIKRALDHIPLTDEQGALFVKRMEASKTFSKETFEVVFTHPKAEAYFTRQNVQSPLDFTKLHWLVTYFTDFRTDSAMIEKGLDFLAKIAEKTNHPFLACAPILTFCAIGIGANLISQEMAKECFVSRLNPLWGYAYLHSNIMPLFDNLIELFPPSSFEKASLAEVNQKVIFGYTALMMLSAFGSDLQAIDLFLSMGTDPNARADDGSTALLLACRQKNLAVVKILINYGANLNHFDEKGMNIYLKTAEDTKALDVERYLEDRCIRTQDNLTRDD